MKSLRKYIALIVCTLSLCAGAYADIVYPLGEECFGFDYDRIFNSAVTTGNASLLVPVGPYSYGTAGNLLDGSRSASFRMFDIERIGISGQDGKIGQVISPLRLFTVSSMAYRGINGSRPQDLPSISAGFAYRPGEHFGVLLIFNLDRARALDPLYTGKKYRGLAGDIEAASLYFRRGKISLSLGRSRFFWGPQRTNLLISETADPFDCLSAAYETRLLDFHFIFARLDDSRPDAADSLRFPNRTFNDNRYLVGHRLDLKLHRCLRLGLFETVLYGGEGRPPELYYLNPLQFFHGAQLNENRDDNTIVGLDFSLLPGKGINFYGQLIVDDFQVDDHTQGDKEPNELGYMLGIFKAGRTGSLIPDLKLEYVRLTNRTYHQSDPRNRYLYRNRLIGHPLGPDADSISFKARFWPDQSFFSEAELAYRRKGEGSIRKPWDEPWLLATGEYSEPFPTGVVEKATLATVRLQGYLPFTQYTRDHFFVSLACGWGEIRNHLNIEGVNETVTSFECRLSWLGFADLRID